MLLWKKWLYGLLAAIIGGGASAVSAGFGTALVDPDKFNIHGGINSLLEVMATTFFISAVTHAAGYLAQSPLPAQVITTTVTDTVTVTKEKA